MENSVEKLKEKLFTFCCIIGYHLSKAYLMHILINSLVTTYNLYNICTISSYKKERQKKERMNKQKNL